MVPVILWITFIVFLVLATLHFLPQLVCWINGGALFSPDVMVNLYVAVFNLEAALLIALLIYSLQVSSERRDHKARSRNAKRILLTELESGLEYIVRQPKAGNTAGISCLLSDLLIAYLPDIQKDLLPNQLHHLIKITDILITMAHQAVEQDSGEAADYLQSHLCFLVREAFLPAMGSPFSDVFFRIGDFRTALNEETRKVLTALASKETSLPPVDGKRLLDTKGNPLVEVMDNGRTRIWDEKGMLLCDAVLTDNNVDLSGVEEGWARLPDYEGEYQNGLRNGHGCSYSSLHHHKLFDGIWQAGKPQVGTWFDIVVQRTGEDTYEKLFPYWKDHSLTESAIMDLFSGEWDEEGVIQLDELFVVDIQRNEDRIDVVNLRPLEQFIEQWDPGHCQVVLDQLREWSGTTIDKQ